MLIIWMGVSVLYWSKDFVTLWRVKEVFHLIPSTLATEQPLSECLRLIFFFPFPRPFLFSIYLSIFFFYIKGCWRELPCLVSAANTLCQQPLPCNSTGAANCEAHIPCHWLTTWLMWAKMVFRFQKIFIDRIYMCMFVFVSLWPLPPECMHVLRFFLERTSVEGHVCFPCRSPPYPPHFVHAVVFNIVVKK